MDDLKQRLTEITIKLKAEEKKARIKKIENESGDPNFWLDQKTAAVRMKELTFLTKQLKLIDDIALWIEMGELQRAAQNYSSEAARTRNRMQA